MQIRRRESGTYGLGGGGERAHDKATIQSKEKGLFEKHTCSSQSIHDDATVDAEALACRAVSPFASGT